MEIGVYLAPEAAATDIAAFAAAAERLGFDSLWLPEHPVMPTVTATPFAGVGGDEIPEAYGRLPDPLIQLAVAAGATSRIGLATGVCLVALRNPLILAKQVATLDASSNGRVTLGIGAGWLREEFEILAGDFRTRWDRTVETIRALKMLWTGTDTSYAGEFVSFPSLRCLPRPVQDPHPPLIVGGKGERALRVAAELGDGWLPVHADVEMIDAGRARLDELAQEAGRDPTAISIVAFGGPARYRSVDDLGALEAHGVAQAVLWVTEPGARAFDQLEELGELVRAVRSSEHA